MIVQHARFLAQVSTQAADKLRRDVVEAAKSLQEFPKAGFLACRSGIARK